MKPRKWLPEEKLAIVMEGLKEKKTVADICRTHQISQTLYYGGYGAGDSDDKGRGDLAERI